MIAYLLNRFKDWQRERRIAALRAELIRSDGACLAYRREILQALADEVAARSAAQLERMRGRRGQAGS